MEEFNPTEDKYAELKFLGQQYRHYMKLHISALQNLTYLIDQTMPGIKGLLCSWNERNGKDKLGDFVERFWYYDLITRQSETEFVEHYKIWAKEIPSEPK